MFCLRSVTNLLADQGDIPQAQSLLQEYIELSGKSESKDSMADALEELAGLLVKKSKLVEARAKYEQAFSIETQLGQTRSIPWARLNLASISLEEGRPADHRRNLCSGGFEWLDARALRGRRSNRAGRAAGRPLHRRTARIRPVFHPLVSTAIPTRLRRLR